MRCSPAIFGGAVLEERGLTLSPDKTRLTHIDEGFDFLGLNLGVCDQDEATDTGWPADLETMVAAGDTPIRRHIKIRQSANPFDPQWRTYFQERAFFARFGIHRHEAGIKPS